MDLTEERQAYVARGRTARKGAGSFTHLDAPGNASRRASSSRRASLAELRRQFGVAPPADLAQHCALLVAPEKAHACPGRRPSRDWACAALCRLASARHR